MPCRAGVSHIVAAVPIHLNPAAELADRVLLPGDPHRALTVAQALLEQPKMFNHRRGLWGYTGTARDGELLTVQATGMGGPSAAIVCEELIELGARTLIRIGTCGAVNTDLGLGDIVKVERALARDGASRALGAGDEVEPDAGLTNAIDAPAVTAVSVDVFYGDPDTSGADVVEMEAATIFQVAKLRGVRAACVLGVSDMLAEGRTRIEQKQLEDLGTRLGEAALAALIAGSYQ
jgi:uridine phosphorylase